MWTEWGKEKGGGGGGGSVLIITFRFGNFCMHVCIHPDYLDILGLRNTILDSGFLQNARMNYLI